MVTTLDTGFWRNRRVFLTGHTGFKGSWMSVWLGMMGAEVTGYALSPETTPSLYREIGGDVLARSVIADIRDLQALRAAMQEAKPEIVIHMAAQPLVRRSYRDPVETYSTNVMGTVHLLQSARETPGVRAVVVVTSDKAYENKEWAWGYRESDPMGGFDPYSSSKGCTELVAQAFRSSYFNPDQYASHRVAVATARAGNVIGGGDWSEDRLIPDLLRAFAADKPALVRNPHAIRPWQHVLEPVAGYLLLAERLFCEGPDWAQAWNFGPSDADAQNVGWIATRLCELWGDGATWSHDGTPQPHEAHFLKLDCSKARQVLGWHPRWTLANALSAIVDWHRNFVTGQPALSLCKEQILRYTLDVAGTIQQSDDNPLKS